MFFDKYLWKSSYIDAPKS